MTTDNLTIPALIDLLGGHSHLNYLNITKISQVTNDHIIGKDRICHTMMQEPQFLLDCNHYGVDMIHLHFYPHTGRVSAKAANPTHGTRIFEYIPVDQLRQTIDRILYDSHREAAREAQKKYFCETA